MTENFKIILLNLFLAISILFCLKTPSPKKVNLEQPAIFCNQVEITVNNLQKLTGVLVFQEPKNFRFQTFHNNQIKSDIGINEEGFWFWSKEMSPPYLFYAKNTSDVSKKLKPEFQPKLFLAALGLNNNKSGFLFKDNQQKTRLKSTFSDYRQEIPTKIKIEIPEEKVILDIRLIKVTRKVVSAETWKMPIKDVMICLD